MVWNLVLIEVRRLTAERQSPQPGDNPAHSRYFGRPAHLAELSRPRLARDRLGHRVASTERRYCGPMRW